MDTTTTSAGMSPMRRTALIAGVAYIGTFIFSVPVKFGLWADVLDEPDFILGAGSSAGVSTGALFEVLTALLGIATAVALYPVARRYSHRSALGFVTSRLLEATMIFAGVLSVMAVHTLRDGAGAASAASADASALSATGEALVAVHDWAFLLGPGLMAVVNAMLIGSIMYRSGLLPRWIPTLGLIGAPLLLVSDVAVLYGVWDQVSGPAMLLTLPIAVWEMSFGIRMAVKGFRSDAVAPQADQSTVPATVAPTYA